jgi:hypothetical protein
VSLHANKIVSYANKRWDIGDQVDHCEYHKSHLVPAFVASYMTKLQCKEESNKRLDILAEYH